MRCLATLIGKQLRAFRRTVMPLTAGRFNSGLYFGFLRKDHF